MASSSKVQSSSNRFGIADTFSPLIPLEIFHHLSLSLLYTKMYILFSYFIVFSIDQTYSNAGSELINVCVNEDFIDIQHMFESE